MTKQLPLLPFLKIFLALLSGVVIAMIAPASISFIAICIIPVALIFIKKYPSVVCYIILVLLGAALPYLQDTKPLPLNKNSHHSMIVTHTTSKEEIYICHSKEVNQEILLIFNKKVSLTLGDSIEATILMEDIRFAHHQLKKLLPNKDVKLCAKVIDLEQITTSQTPYIRYPSLPKRVNRWCVNRIEKLNISESDIAIINGMLLGNRENIDKEQQEQYNNTGISHMLSISGMHIGILFMILNALFIFRNKSFIGRISGSVLIIITLWLYTIMVGSPISALRATMMFTILQISFMRITSPLQIFNTLFATATLFTLIDYNMVFDIGFQLSFISLLSIILFMPLFGRSNYLKDILIVTISAQILTTPLVLHYFGYFSVISVIANLFGAVAIYGIMICAIGFIIYPNELCEWIIRALFDCFNAILKFLSDMPYSHIKDIHFSITDIVIYYIIVYLIYDFVVSSTKKHT